MRAIRRVLIVRQDKLGDVLMSTPVFAALKRAYPSVHLEVWAQSEVAEMLRADPHVDVVRTVSFHPRLFESLRLVLWALRGRFDAVLLLRPESTRFLIASWLARIPRRIGCSARKWYPRLLTDNLQGRVEHLHQVDRNLRQCASLFGIEPGRIKLHVTITDEDRVEAQALLTRHAVGLAPADAPKFGAYFIVHIGGGGSAKSWSPERFTAVAHEIRQRAGLLPVFTGVDAEREVLVSRLRELGPPYVDLLGKTKFRVLAAVVERARLVLCGGTSVAHIAAATQSPCVMVDPTAPSAARLLRFHPYETPQRTFGGRVACAGCEGGSCHRRGSACVESIAVDEVVEGCLSLVR